MPIGKEHLWSAAQVIGALDVNVDPDRRGVIGTGFFMRVPFERARDLPRSVRAAPFTRARHRSSLPRMRFRHAHVRAIRMFGSRARWPARRSRATR